MHEADKPATSLRIQLTYFQSFETNLSLQSIISPVHTYTVIEQFATETVIIDNLVATNYSPC